MRSAGILLSDISFSLSGGWKFMTNLPAYWVFGGSYFLSVDGSICVFTVTVKRAEGMKGNSGFSHFPNH